MDECYTNIINRRSVRQYIDSPITKEIIDKLLTAASYAPSGKNCQPWRFVVITRKYVIQQLAGLTVYSRFIKAAPCIIVVFLDEKSSYDYKKDVMAIGASIQNILIVAQEQGLTSCWIGEILNREDKVKLLLKIDNDLSLMAVISIGQSPPGGISVPVSKRKSLSELIIKNIQED